MNTTPLSVILLGLSGAVLLGQSNSSSASFDLLHAPLTGGGGQVSNGSDIVAEISVGGAIGGPVSNVTTGGVQSTPNYIGQLYDVTILTPTAAPDSVEEGGMRQLGATSTMDDLSQLILVPDDVQWSVLLGPLTGIDTAGLVAADVVYEDTDATVQGAYQGVAGSLVLTVLNADPDNFRSYGGDGLADAWQIDFFGNPPNPDAAPGANPDHDPHNNWFEFLTGYDPTDPGDYLSFDVIDLSGTTATLELSKIIPGTRYRIERSNEVRPGSWSEFANFTTPLEALDSQLSDPNATGRHWFYRLSVEPE